MSTTDNETILFVSASSLYEDGQFECFRPHHTDGCEPRRILGLAEAVSSIKTVNNCIELQFLTPVLAVRKRVRSGPGRREDSWVAFI